MAKIPVQKTVESIKHGGAKRKNIPTAEYRSVMKDEEQNPIRIAYERRNRDLDPQLVWRGKDEQDWSDLVVQAPPLYIQEKVHPKVLIDDLQRHSEEGEGKKPGVQRDLFADFNGLPDENAKTEFYQHDAHWSNRMILGDSLQVMASLAEREGLRGKVQCIYIDPPYGIKFNSNFQWSTTSRDVKDGNLEHITREPEQVKAFRDTWRDGIHSYLTYLRDRLTVARDLLTESGSIFVQIGDENVHRIRALMDEIFGEENFISSINFRKKTMPLGSNFIEQMSDHIIWFSKSRDHAKGKFKSLYRDYDVLGLQDWKWVEESGFNRRQLSFEEHSNHTLLPKDSRVYRLKHPSPIGNSDSKKFSPNFNGRVFRAPINGWGLDEEKFEVLRKANRLQIKGNTINYIIFHSDFSVTKLTNPWVDTTGPQDKQYVVQTGNEVIQRCILMTTDPGDLVLDPTCGSGTTAYVAEQWGRRWITIDTSRVALALARARIMGARYPYYLLADSPEGQLMEAKLTATAPSTSPTFNDIRHGFVYERVPHITLKSIANNAEIDIIWEEFQVKLEPLRSQLNTALNKTWEEWEIPRDADPKWPEPAKKFHGQWWELRIARQKKIDASISAHAEFEYLYDKPYDDKKKIRVAGPFTVESLSPHRVLSVDEDDELIDELALTETKKINGQRIPMDFSQMILENIKTSGVQQAHKEDKINFSSITAWPGDLVCAEGHYLESGCETGKEKRAAIFIGPEFGTVSRPDLVQAAREAGDAGFDVLITCAFNYDAHSTEFAKLGRIQVLKARMNADLHMAGDLKNTGKGNLFVIFGEPDIDIHYCEKGYIQVQVKGVEVFHPNTGEVRSDGPDGIACWFIDTDYNEESFFVRHAYFLGANDPYKALKTTLKAQVNEEAWESLHSAVSRPFKPPESGRIAVKVINHLGDEVMKVFRVK
ncbi:MAG: site-specific DNA-methyltransferase [Acidobacteria bacterium]|nr:site-specific DNA-methyltransferase [Acidobacteriota bacterium]